jgi:O-Antigen ligase
VHNGESATEGAEVALAQRPLSRILAVSLVVLLSALLVEILFEGWLVTVLGTRRVDSSGNIVLDLAMWPKTVKNALFITLLAVSAAKLTVDRRWTELRTPADLALGVLGLVLLAAGLFNASPASLIGQALFVYFRGVIVFYAWRVLDPSLLVVRRFLWIFGGLISAYAAIAAWQMIYGYPTYAKLGWVDMTWARINRAQALMTHPNDLGHVTGLMLLGLMAWFVASPRVAVRWWVLFALVAAGLAATQSRESMIGVLGGTVLIALVRRARYGRLAAATGLVVLMATMPLVVSPSNRIEWARRVHGVISAVNIPSASESSATTPPPGGDIPCDPNSADCASTELPGREIRVLYAQQGLRLWVHRPLLGYGVGQFGGIVAYRHDPNWNLDPRFGPGGFNRYGFNAKTVDSFWLHLLVETGVLGTIAYVVWIYLLAAPLLRDAWRRDRPRENPAPAVVYWAPAALAFGALIAVFAPSLEDPLFPALMFSILGIAWVALRRPEYGPTPENAPSVSTQSRTPKPSRIDMAQLSGEEGRE